MWAANKVGFKFFKGTPVLYQMVNEHTGETETWEIFNVIEFNSTRKRMSIICKTPEGKILLLTKGADNVIMERLDREKKMMSEIEPTSKHLDAFAEIGLRTLCLAYKELTEEEYNTFQKKYHQASISLTDREAKQDVLSDELEKGLVLIGATAIEDKLQDGVPEAIETLATAGIKIWVLTGDKQETAINIAFSCKLFTNQMNIHILSGAKNATELKAKIMDIMMREVGGGDPTVQHAIVIDGATLTMALCDAVKMEVSEASRNCYRWLKKLTNIISASLNTVLGLWLALRSVRLLQSFPEAKSRGGAAGKGQPYQPTRHHASYWGRCKRREHDPGCAHWDWD